MSRPRARSKSVLSSQKSVTLNPNLSKRLLQYAGASTAAAAGLIACSHSAEAKVIYTATNVVIPFQSTLPLDLNNDGIPDFTFDFCYCGSHTGVLTVSPDGTGNLIRGTGGFAAAGFFGVPVGPRQQFQSGGFMASAGQYGGVSHWSGGLWLNATNRYLGLKFIIKGQVHFGWARLTVGIGVGSSGPTTLTGYAFETTPNTAIIEGHISGAEIERRATSPTDLTALELREAGLGQLAAGAPGLALWRREGEDF